MLRRKVAERISKVKERAGLETPMLDEVPLRAERIESLELPFPRVRGVIPVIAKGRATGAVAGRWYRVVFPRPIADPTVVCVGLARKGEVPRVALPDISVGAVEKLRALEKLVDIPSIAELKKILAEAIPDISIPKISISVPRWTMVVPTADDFVALIKKHLGDWGWLNWVRDSVAWAIGNFEFAIWDAIFKPRALIKLNDEVLTPIRNSIQNVRDGINTSIDRINDRLEDIRTTLNTKLGEVDARLNDLRVGANDRLKKVGAGVDERFETLRTGVNSRFGELRTNTQDAVQNAFAQLFPRLYAAWGLRKDMALTALHIRNVTSTGFEFQSYGNTTAHWIAVGERL